MTAPLQQWVSPPPGRMRKAASPEAGRDGSDYGNRGVVLPIGFSHLFILFEDLTRSSISTERGSVLPALADQPLSKILVEQDFANGPRYIENVLGIDQRGSIADHFGQ